MFSGKSTELQRKIKRYQHANKKCLVINYIKDNRYSSEDVASTHDLVMIPAKKMHHLSDLSDAKALEYDVIGIDEGQFFDDLITTVDRWANYGIIIIIAALDSTFQRKGFGSVPELIAISENVKKLSSICTECNNKASFTKRLSKDTDVEVVGGSEIYKPVCRNCFNKDLDLVPQVSSLSINKQPSL